MIEKRNEMLTPGQTVGLLVGFAIGPEFLKLPNLLVPIAKQDSWISALIALLSPLIVIFFVLIIVKKYPKDNLMDINKKCFGKIFGTVLNIIFLIQFVLLTGSIISEFARLSRIFIVGFLSPLKISVVCLAVSFYVATLGIKTLGKISETITYFIIGIILLTVFIFKEGSLLNLMPVFETDAQTILKASVRTAYFYGGFEALLLIHPRIKDVNSIKASTIKAFLISGFIWVWSVFSTIYYMGIDIIPKALWSFFFVYGAVTFPIINNVRYVFMFVWSIVTFRIVANYIALNTIMIKGIIKLKTSIIYLALIGSILVLSNLFANDLLRQKIFNILSPSYVIFNIVLLLTIILITYLKRREKSSSYD
jgi:spore germination protein